MFYFLAALSKKVAFLSFFRLFDSLLFRSLAAMTTALLFSLIFGKPIIDRLYKAGMRDVIRDYGGIGTNDKKGTPTMGGVLIIASLLTSILLWTNLSSMFVWLSVASMLWFGGIGAYDDVMKVKHKNSDKGLSQLRKIFLQLFFATALAVILYNHHTTPFSTALKNTLYVPFIKNIYGVYLGWLYVPFAVFTVVAIANAVNFADGLDGLSIMPSITTGAVYGIFAYIIGNFAFSKYLLFNYVPGVGEMAVIMAALFGAGLGFLWYNCYPATIFMGDTGSMAIGGLLATVVLCTKQELVFVIAGGVFVVEALSVLIQQKVGNLTGRRYFFRAPIHHTFQHRGLPETKIVPRFWIISIILAMVSLFTLKIR